MNQNLMSTEIKPDVGGGVWLRRTVASSPTADKAMVAVTNVSKPSTAPAALPTTQLSTTQLANYYHADRNYWRSMALWFIACLILILGIAIGYYIGFWDSDRQNKPVQIQQQLPHVNQA